MTRAERQAALEVIAGEVRACTRCRLHETRTQAVPGEGDPSTEVVFVGEGPGMNEDRLGRPFVGRAGDLHLQVGDVVTVEPGVYREGFGGIRVEDLVVVTSTGCRALTQTPKDSPCPPSPPTT